MFSDYRLGPLLWAAGFLLFGILLLLFNFDQLVGSEPVIRLLLASTPGTARGERRETRPPAAHLGDPETDEGCSFVSRCSEATPSCREVRPELEVIGGGRRLRCPVCAPAREGERVDQ